MPRGEVTESVVDGKVIRRGPNGIEVLDELPEPTGRIPKKGEWDENLADQMEKAERQQLAERLIEYFDIDKESRKEWEESERRGLALAGIKKIPIEDPQSGEVNAPGQAQVKTPLVMEASTHFQSRAIAELFPATGPLKVQVLGKETPELTEQRDRVETFGNHYLTKIDTGYFPDTDQMLMYLPLSGSVFRKASQNRQSGLPELRYVKATDFVVNYAATSLADADRYAHAYPVSGLELRKAQDLGLWANIDLAPEKSFQLSKRATSDTSDGRSLSLHDDDQLYDIIEYHIDLVVDQDGNAKATQTMDAESDIRPYIVIVERTNREVLMVRRNWNQSDKQCRKIIWFSHHKFFPGLGFYGWGYPHLLGSLQKAVDDGINALLDAGFAANFRGGFVTQEGSAVGMTGEFELEHGKYKVIKGTWDEINKAIYSPEFKEPSTGLANLVVNLIEAFRRFASITETAVGDADNKGPVGTTIALIEQSNIVPTAIHKRLHQSFGEEFEMWARAVHMFMPEDRYPFQIGNEKREVFRQDFDGRVDVVPVSDPNISSKTQRIALCQATLELQGARPDIYPVDAVIEAHKRTLKAMGVPDPDAVGPRIDTPKYLDPVSESQMLISGKGVKAFETQDHRAHRAVHMHAKAKLMNSPEFQSWQPERQQAVLGAFEAHDADHLALEFRREMMATVQVPLPPLDENGQPPELPPEIEAEVTAAIVARLPPPPPLPAAGANGAAEADAALAKTRAAIQGKQEETTAKIERDTAEWEAEMARQQVEHQAEMQRMREKHEAELAAMAQKTEAQSALTVAAGAQKLDVSERLGRQKVSQGERATAAKLRQGEAASQAKLRQGDQAHGQKLKQGDEAHGQKLAQGDRTHAQQLLQGAQKTEAELQAAEARTGQELQHNDAAHEQAMKHLEADAELAAKHAEGEHKQGIRHKASEHAQQTRHANEDHEREGRFAEDDHQRESKQSKESHEQELTQGRMKARTALSQQRESGKLKISQAKDAARAKKQAAKKKALKK